MSFNGLTVLSLESRRAAEMAKLIGNNGGVPVVAPSMREVPLEENRQVFEFFDLLRAGAFDMTVFLTGVGARALNTVIATRHSETELAAELRKTAVVVRGPKPMAVMREWGVPVAAFAPEPNTWREVLAVTEGRPERNVAVQEFGRPSPELTAGLRGRGCTVTTVPVYRYGLPEDLAPLRDAVERILRGKVDVLLLTTGVQIDHLVQVAPSAGELLAALRSVAICSIGPSCTEALEEHGLKPDLEPSHPKMGILVKESAERSGDILSGKRC